jgi:hypothetical protein
MMDRSCASSPSASRADDSNCSRSRDSGANGNGSDTYPCCGSTSCGRARRTGPCTGPCAGSCAGSCAGP